MRSHLFILPPAAFVIFATLIFALKQRLLPSAHAGQEATAAKEAPAREPFITNIRFSEGGLTNFPCTRYKARVLEAHDGDTMTVLVDLGMDTFRKTGVRFDGIDAPERNTPEGKASAAFVQKLLTGKDVVLAVKAGHEREKFGRLLATVWLGSTNVCDLLIREGLAVEYHGGKRGEPAKKTAKAAGVDWNWKRGEVGDADAYGQKGGGP